MTSNNTHFDARRFSAGQGRGMNLSSRAMAAPANFGQLMEESTIQQDISQQLFSSDGSQDFQAFSASPTPTPPLPTSSHAYPSHHQLRQFSPTSHDASHFNVPAASSTQYGQLVTSASDLNGTYATDMNFGGMAMHNVHDNFGFGNINTTVPTSMQPLASRAPSITIGHMAAVSQYALPPFSTAQIPSPLSAAPRSPLPVVYNPNSRTRQQPAQFQQQSRETGDDVIIGHILASKKVRCAKPGCHNSSFNRLADFRRHHDQQHARNRAIYYCPHSGCSRSHAYGGGRGRSFGTRKDKCDEHIRTVHKDDPRPGEPQQYSPVTNHL